MLVPVWNCLVAPWRAAMHGMPYSLLTTAPGMKKKVVKYARLKST